MAEGIPIAKNESFTIPVLEIFPKKPLNVGKSLILPYKMVGKSLKMGYNNVGKRIKGAGYVKKKSGKGIVGLAGR